MLFRSIFVGLFLGAAHATVLEERVCKLGKRGSCGVNGVCVVNRSGVAYCECKKGFTGTHCGKTAAVTQVKKRQAGSDQPSDETHQQHHIVSDQPSDETRQPKQHRSRERPRRHHRVVQSDSDSSDSDSSSSKHEPSHFKSASNSHWPLFQREE